MQLKLHLSPLAAGAVFMNWLSIYNICTPFRLEENSHPFSEVMNKLNKTYGFELRGLPFLITSLS